MRKKIFEIVGLGTPMLLIFMIVCAGAYANTPVKHIESDNLRLDPQTGFEPVTDCLEGSYSIR